MRLDLDACLFGVVKKADRVWDVASFDCRVFTVYIDSSLSTAHVVNLLPVYDMTATFGFHTRLQKTQLRKRIFRTKVRRCKGTYEFFCAFSFADINFNGRPRATVKRYTVE